MSDREAKLSRSTDSADAHARIAELEARLAIEARARSDAERKLSTEAVARSEAEKKLSAETAARKQAEKDLAEEKDRIREKSRRRKNTAHRHRLANDNCRQGRSIRFDRVCRNSASNAAACIEQRQQCVVVDVGCDHHRTRCADAVE
jgi:predicted  nucleic acid-binding Zn-ribbon protein